MSSKDSCARAGRACCRSCFRERTKQRQRTGRAAATRNKPPIRFQEMDRNNDRVITRDEWRGSDQSFKVHDWNGDGKLSGNEVRVGAARDDRATGTAVPITSTTTNGNTSSTTGRTAGSAPSITIATIASRATNGTSIAKGSAGPTTTGTAPSRARNSSTRMRWTTTAATRFPYLDANRDGRLSRDEWHGSASRFATLDVNHDGFISRTEMLGTAAPPDLFTSLDMNRDRVITPNEWQWSRASFDRLDLNRDGKLSVAGVEGTRPRRTGSKRRVPCGLRTRADRRTTGRPRGSRSDDRAWDLEGQTELEQADSGYNSSMGPRADYQTGYREAFRRAYREGWDAGQRGS